MARGSQTEAFKRQFAARLTELVERHLGLSFNEVSEAMGYTNSSTVLKAARAAGCLDVERLSVLAGLTTPDGRSPNLHWLICGTGPPTLSASRYHDQALPLDSLRREVVEKVRQLDREKAAAMLALLGS
jgi:hypothetical protein